MSVPLTEMSRRARYSRKNSFRSALRFLTSPDEMTKESTCQFAFGPLQRFQV